jgi:CMP-N-acetylneuraminic acid synthetase
MSEPLRPGLRRLAIVPARGSSKGLPGKNLALVAGESLLARAVRCAREAAIFDAVLVSTDDAAIADEGRRAGAQVPFLRPPALASDRAAVIDAIRDALVRLEAGGAAHFDTVALLEPTSPLRTPEIVRRTVAAAESDGADAALTVSAAPARYHPLKHFRIDATGIARHAVAEGAQVVNRQELNQTFLRNGMCYAVRRSALDAGYNVLGSAARAVPVDGPAVNIDDAVDLAEARRLLEGNGQKLGGADR